jgi:hypothetical protein
MGYPKLATVRRSSNVSDGRGFRPSTYDRARNASSSSNARTPLKPYVPNPGPSTSDVRKLVNYFETRQVPITDIVARTLLRSLGPLAGFVTGYLLELLLEYYLDQLSPDSDAYSKHSHATGVVLGGWTQCPTPTGCTAGPDWFVGFLPLGASCNTIAGCGVTGPGAGGFTSPNAAVSGNQGRLVIQGKGVLGTWENHSQWTRPGTNTTQALKRYVLPNPLEVPDAPPWIDPFNHPGLPVPDFQPVPWQDIPNRPEFRPDRSPLEQPVRGPQPAQRPLYRPEIFPASRPLTRDLPGPTIVIEPGKQIKFEWPRPMNPQPPKGRTKERKVRVGPKGGIATAISFVTEARDVINAIWKAVPKDCRSKPEKGRRTVTAYVQAKDIYRCFGSIDILRAMKNVVEDQLIQDRFYGMAGKAYRDSAQRLFEHGFKRATGLQTGDRYRPKPDLSDFDVSDPKKDYYDKFFEDNLPKWTPKDAWRALHP